MARDLDGRVAIVTGSSRGIGRAVALELAAHGADIVVGARTEQASDERPGTIAETADAVRAAGARTLPVRVDVTDDRDLERLVEATLAEFGRIDVLVNNAGALGGRGPFIGGDPTVLDHFVRTNLRAPFVLAQLVAAKMAESGGGAIFNMSSGLARSPAPPSGDGDEQRGPSSAIYGATKAAMDRWSAGVAAELYEQQIAIISIYPGFTLTETMRLRLPPGADTSRMERPETAGKAIAYLCLDPMAYTGQTVEARAVVDAHGL
jgi:NAD(P)-dependent dehydrogenase (short-subunit alcohol dehydrogenase family)